MIKIRLGISEEKLLKYGFIYDKLSDSYWLKKYGLKHNSPMIIKDNIITYGDLDYKKINVYNNIIYEMINDGVVIKEN